MQFKWSCACELAQAGNSSCADFSTWCVIIQSLDKHLLCWRSIWAARFPVSPFSPSAFLLLAFLFFSAALLLSTPAPVAAAKDILTIVWLKCIQLLNDIVSKSLAGEKEFWKACQPFVEEPKVDSRPCVTASNPDVKTWNENPRVLSVTLMLWMHVYYALKIAFELLQWLLLLGCV